MGNKQPRAKFCTNCGTRLDADSGGKPGDKSLERFTPPELMAKFEATRAQDGMTVEETRLRQKLEFG